MADELWTPWSHRIAEDSPGYSMPDESAASAPVTKPTMRERMAGYKERLPGSLNAAAAAYAERTPRKFTNKPETTAFLNSMDPTGKAAGGWETTKWAFRGNRTVDPGDVRSMAGRQNWLGGVQRDVIPTQHITPRKMEGPPSTGSVPLEYQETYTPSYGQQQMQPGTPQTASQTPPPPMQQMGMPMRAGPPPPTFDPIFAQNTGSTTFNPNQFGDPHQRATAPPLRQQR